MSEDQHHHDALIETARAELNRAHAGALEMSSGEIRRGLETALAALRESASLPGGVPRPGVMDGLGRALAELDAGQLAEMEREIETARRALEA